MAAAQWSGGCVFDSQVLVVSSSSWLTNVDEIKDLWCSFAVWIITFC